MNGKPGSTKFANGRLTVSFSAAVATVLLSATVLVPIQTDDTVRTAPPIVAASAVRIRVDLRVSLRPWEPLRPRPTAASPRDTRA